MRRVVMIVVVAVLLAACDSGTSTGTSAPTTTVASSSIDLLTADRAEWWRRDRQPAAPPDVVQSCQPPDFRLPLDMLIHSAPVIVAGTVAGVEGPFWNQASGGPWEADYDTDFIDAWMYREVTLDVDEVLWDDLGLPDPVTFIASGHGGPQVQCPDNGPPFGTGDQVIVLLSSRAFLLRENAVDVIQDHGAAYGTLRVFTVGDELRYRQYRQSTARVTVEVDDPIPERYPDGITLDEFRRLVLEVKATDRPDDQWDSFYELETAAEIRELLGLPDPPTP